MRYLTRNTVWRSFRGLTNKFVTKLKKSGYTSIKYGAIVDGNKIYNPVGLNLYSNAGYDLDELIQELERVQENVSC